MKTIMVTQRLEDFGKIKPIPYAFRDWLHKLNRNEKLPRGKYFKGKVGGKPIVILDEFWSFFNTQYSTSIHSTSIPDIPYFAIKDYGSLREILLEDAVTYIPTEEQKRILAIAQENAIGRWREATGYEGGLTEYQQWISSKLKKENNDSTKKLSCFKDNIVPLMDKPSADLDKIMLLLEDHSTRTYIPIPRGE